jgi:hypothetical protein
MQDDISIELLPCPFCGGSNLSEDGPKRIWCETCAISVHKKDWNLRANRWSAFTGEELDTLRSNFLVFGKPVKNRLFDEAVSELKRRKSKKESDGT